MEKHVLLSVCCLLRQSSTKALTLLLLLFSLSVHANNSSEYYEKALDAFEAEKYEDAYIHLKNSLKQDQDNLPAKILMGRVLMISGYIDEAETEFEEALAAGADPNLVVDPYGKTLLFLSKYDQILDLQFKGLTTSSTTNWNIIVATANLNLGNLEDARRQYTRILNENPRHVRVLNALASLELESGNFADARNYLDRVLQETPEDTISLRLLGELYLRQQEFEKAEAALEKGFDLDPDDPLIKRSLVSVYLQNQDQIKAEILLDKILKQTPNDPVASLINAWLLALKDNNALAKEELEKLSSNLASLSEERLAQNPSHLYVAALAAFAQQNFESARNYFTEYLIRAPDNLDAINLLAQTLIKLGQQKLALEVMVRHERQFASRLDSALMLGNLYLSNNKAFKALELLRRLKREYPGNKRVELLEIKTLIARDKIDEAFEALDASEHITTDFSFILTKSMLLLNAGYLDRALQVSDQLLELAPNHVDFLNYKSAVLIKMRRWQEAKPLVEEVLRQSPQHYSGRFNQASILKVENKLPEALAIMEELNKQQPDNIATMTLLAKMQFDAGQSENALLNMQRVLEKDIDNIPAHELLTTLHIRSGDLERAQRQVAELIKILPTEPKYMLQKAELYIMRKMKDRAIRELQKVDKLLENDDRNLLTLANLYLRADRPELAKQTISRAANALPDNQYLSEQFVRLHIFTRDFSVAGAKLASLRKAHPDDVGLMILEGDFYSAQNDHQTAGDKFAAILALYPEHNIVLAKYYQVTLKGVHQEAFSDMLTNLLETNPQNHFQRNILADHFVNTGQYDKARPHYEMLIPQEELPNYIFILNNLANIYIESDLNKAESLITKASEINGNHAVIIDTVGWIKALRGDLDEALTMLRQAYAMSSEDPSIKYHLAYTLHKLGKSEEAKRELTQALRSQDNFMERDKAQALLDSI